MRAWMRRGWFARCMWPSAALFKILVNLRFALFLMGYKRSTCLPVPVIIVGNIFVGGTGKTPLVIWLAQQLRQSGWQPGVISRGYGAAEQVLEVTPEALAIEVGDEPLLIATKTASPVFVGRDRVAAAQALLARHPQVNVVISDDGLQHYALQRDIEIVLFDQRGVGNGWTLPAGPLRETALRRRDFTVLNAGSNFVPSGVADDAIRMQLQLKAPYSLRAPEKTMPTHLMQGQRILAVAGMGNPERFFTSLRNEGLQFTALALDDHHEFSTHSFDDVEADLILMTEKDAVKCAQIDALKNDARVWVIPVEAQLESDFFARVLAKLMNKKVEREHGSTTA
ncbi:MAG: tetraacyldisaccharide 4'-kinase [Burkholderiaceae bacterium]|nr:tetraacyldisaccharide 4'-kinase [Burkholderiaceae bacterium]